MNVFIRPFHENDIEELQKLVAPLFSIAFYWDPVALNRELSAATTWVLESQGQIASFICMRDLGQAWDLTLVASRLEFQRKGFMEKLMNFVISKYAGQRQLWLEVHQDNFTAQKFYQKMGFIHTGTRGGYYKDGSAALLFTFGDPDFS